MPIRRWGPERLVNTTATGPQAVPRVAALTGGGFVVAWRDDASATPAVRVQRFDAAGARLGAEITVAEAAEPGGEIAVAGTAEGGFLVAWVGPASPTAGTVQTKVYAADGTLLRAQPAVIDTELPANPEVARLGAGIAVVWERPAIGYAALRLLDAAGHGGFIYPDIIPEPAPTAQPGIVVAANADASRLAVAGYYGGSGLLVRLYDPAGTMVGVRTVWAVSIGGPQTISYSGTAMAWASDGLLAVGWKETDSQTGLDTLWLQHLRITGSWPAYNMLPAGSAVRINAGVSGQRDGLVLTALPTGGTVASWVEQGALRLQGFDVGGNRLGGEMRVNPPGELAAAPSVAALPDGRVAVAWQGPDDADAGEIHLQIVDSRDGIVTGSAGPDTLYGHDQVNDEIAGGTGNDTLHGLRGDDLLLGGAGNDVLDGGAGTDEMHGGTGDDLYILDTASDMAVELHRQGHDTVQTGAFGIDLALYPFIENATLTGPLGLFARGTDGANILNGAANGAANALMGKGGDDTYIVGAGDLVSEAPGGGFDTVQSGTISLSLAAYAGVENITLTGALALSATGNAGRNAIDGERNSAANVLTGLGGDDLYTVGVGDTVVEAAGGGVDTVRSATRNLALAQFPQVENLALLGSLPLTGTGTAGANILDGAGNSAANILAGLGGSDTYVVGPGDTVVEAPGAGIDRVESALIDIDLAAYPNTEWLRLRGTMPLAGTGTAGADILDGSFNSAANALTGLGGNDIYVLGPGDTALEAPGGGTDQVQAWSVSLDLAAHPNVENATLTGSMALDIAGTAAANVLTGNAGANVLTGNGGGDTLVGLGGTDTLVGGAGADAFRFLAPGDSAVGAARDVIQAFSAAEGDRIDLAAIDADPTLAGDQAFSFHGSAAFTGAGQVRFMPSGADVIVQGTVDGATIAFEILVAGTASLEAGDVSL